MADQEVDAKFLYWAMSAKHPRYTTISLYDYWDESERHIALISFRAATASHAAEVEANARDAERYRWLRQHAHARTYRDVRCFVEVPRGPCDPELLEVRGQKLDESIDAALKGDKP